MRGRVPTFAVPRFVRIRDTLPPTPSEKIQRNVLRAEAATVEGIADREQLAIGN